MNDLQNRLIKHLHGYGIRHFSGEEYWEWGGEKLGQKVGRQINRFRKPLSESEPASPGQVKRFYDFIAEPQIASVVHSMKADAIRKSGEFIESRLPVRGDILDVGCSLGYLATYYAKMKNDRRVVGVDLSQKTIANAQRIAQKRGIDNVEFVHSDIVTFKHNEKFDAVCSAQTIGQPYISKSALSNISNCLRSEGLLISVEALGNADAALEYISEATNYGLGLIEFEFVCFRDIGERGGYPAFVFKKGAGSNVDDKSIIDGYKATLSYLAEDNMYDG